jgi:hypothetical protein
LIECMLALEIGPSCLQFEITGFIQCG